jgi:hypothetical protein
MRCSLKDVLALGALVSLSLAIPHGPPRYQNADQIQPRVQHFMAWDAEVASTTPDGRSLQVPTSTLARQGLVAQAGDTGFPPAGPNSTLPFPPPDTRGSLPRTRLPLPSPGTIGPPGPTFPPAPQRPFDQDQPHMPPNPDTLPSPGSLPAPPGNSVL